MFLFSNRIAFKSNQMKHFTARIPKKHNKSIVYGFRISRVFSSILLWCEKKELLVFLFFDRTFFQSLPYFSACTQEVKLKKFNLPIQRTKNKCHIFHAEFTIPLKCVQIQHGKYGICFVVVCFVIRYTNKVHKLIS